MKKIIILDHNECTAVTALIKTVFDKRVDEIDPLIRGALEGIRAGFKGIADPERVLQKIREAEVILK